MFITIFGFETTQTVQPNSLVPRVKEISACSILTQLRGAKLIHISPTTTLAPMRAHH
jgi:hypothetical protein